MLRLFVLRLATPALILSCVLWKVVLSRSSLPMTRRMGCWLSRFTAVGEGLPTVDGRSLVVSRGN